MFPDTVKGQKDMASYVSKQNQQIKEMACLNAFVPSKILTKDTYTKNEVYAIIEKIGHEIVETNNEIEFQIPDNFFPEIHQDGRRWKGQCDSIGIFLDLG